MKKVFSFFFIIMCLTTVVQAQYFSGKWEGELSVGPNKLPLVFHISQATAQECSVTLDSPLQGATGIECDGTIDGTNIEITIPNIGASFKGIMEGTDVISGTFSQNGFNLPLKLFCTQFDNGGYGAPLVKLENKNNILFKNGDVTLAGTIAMPDVSWGVKGPYPAVVLVSGSGTQDRDESILGHKPFKVISDFLTQHGVAVLRYDDRGAGESSPLKGDETTMDFAQDAKAAFDCLAGRKLIDTKRIGYIGHSEGGQIAFINAASDPNVAFVISLAGPAVSGSDVMVQQNLSILNFQGIPYTESQVDELKTLFNHIATIEDTVNLRETLLADLAASTLQHYTPEQIKQNVAVMTSPWYMSSIRFNPTPYLHKINCPVLALNGEWDFQVDAKQNLDAIKANVKNATCITLPGHNHLFQEASSRAESMNYGALGDISQQTLDAILEFIKKQ